MSKKLALVETTPPPAMVRPLIQSRLELRSLSLLTDNPVQPAIRQTDSAVQELKRYADESGFFVPPVITSNDIILDGHRRVHAARALGIETLQCVVVDIEDDMVGCFFVWLNSGIRKVTGATLLNVYAKAGSRRAREELLKQFTPTIRAQVKKFVAIFGDERTIEIGQEGHQAPQVVKGIERVHSLLASHDYQYEIRAVGEWVLAHKLQDRLNKTFRGGATWWTTARIKKVAQSIKRDEFPDYMTPSMK